MKIMNWGTPKVDVGELSTTVNLRNSFFDSTRNLPLTIIN
jgi:hypothetical protein